MGELGTLDELLAGAFVEAEVHRLRPDYRVMPVAVDGMVPSPGDDTSDALLQAAEAAARKALEATAVEQLPHVAHWREAYRAFGAKPQRTLSDLALQRATDDLVTHLGRLGPDVRAARRLLSADTTASEGA
jgi:hypothetical protein